MALQGAGGNRYLHWTPTGGIPVDVATRGLSVFFWVRVTATGKTVIFGGVGMTGTHNYVRLDLSGGTARMVSNTGTGGSTVTGASVAADTWTPILGTIYKPGSSQLHTIYQNDTVGTASDSNNVSATMGWAVVSAVPSSLAATGFNAPDTGTQMAEFAVWDGVIGSDAYAMLRAGVPPSEVRPDCLKIYAPLVADWASPLSGPVQFQENVAYSQVWIDPPPVMPRVRRLFQVPAAASGVTLNIPAANIAIAAAVPSVATGVNAAVPAADIALAALAPSVATGASVAAPAADIAIAGVAPGVAAGVNVAVPAADIAIAAQVPTVTASSALTLNVPISEIVIGALAPDVIAAGGIRGRHPRGRKKLWAAGEVPPELAPAVSAAEQLAPAVSYVVDAVDEARSRYNRALARQSLQEQQRVLREAEAAIMAAVRRAQDEDDDDAMAVVL